MAEADITTQMNTQLSIWEQQADRRADFLRCYYLMTENMLHAIAAQEFHDGPWVNHLLHHFAGYYFLALDAYEHQDAQTPTVWFGTHQITDQAHTPVLQNVLLGINAHINYDLVLTLYDLLSPEWAQLSPTGRRHRYEDHCHVNTIIARTIDAVQDQVIETRDPLLALVDTLLGPVDEWSVSRLIRQWREEVWQHAEQMLAAPTAVEREQLRQQIEQETLQRAQTIGQILRFTGQ